jgi:nucleoside-diphosphate-sugar epimerase
MRVFVTGATGFIGTVVVADLIKAGHQVLGLSRSEDGAKALTAAGAQVQRGHLEDLESLRSGAAACDGVIHTAFIHDFANFKKNCEIDQRAIETLGDALAGTNKPLVVSGGIHPSPGRATTEDDAPTANSPLPRMSEQTAIAMAAKGVRATTIRLPQVHDREKAGLVTYLIAVAREKGVSAYVGQGQNRWPAAHKLDVAPLYRLALEKGTAGARYHAVVESGVPLRQIAEAIGQRWKLPVVSKTPEEAAAHFGWLAYFAGADVTASNALTKQRLGWHPTQTISLVDDLV